MAQLVVRNLEEKLKVRLQRRAARHGRSMEEEILGILRDALQDTNENAMVGFARLFRPMYAEANMGHPSLTSASFAAYKFRP